ncbi:Rieske 2Fe-2S domain-containing protein [Streptomyces sp. NPDC001852]|uniref:Rieske 2Fe-2S domain-containing protein n=1 Tax=Streptomyces sp. NPDC001852 TaxID=3364619 RepID=UPI0036C560CD
MPQMSDFDVVDKFSVSPCVWLPAMPMRDELPRPRGPHADVDEPGRHLPYPSGWFCLARSRELAPGKALTRRLMGEDIVLYRTCDAWPRAVDPYCPHLGAHLGAGREVEGQNLVCPWLHLRPRWHLRHHPRRPATARPPAAPHHQ